MPIKPYTPESKAKGKKITVRELHFADDAAFVVHSAQELRTLLSQFSSACLDLGPPSALKN